MTFELPPAAQALQSVARRLAEQAIAPRAAEVDRAEAYPWDNVAALRDAGLLGYTIPQAYGGAGGSFLDAVVIIEEMARVCGVTGRIAVETNMGAISAVMQYGSEAQQRLAARLVLDGDKPAICITEPDAGSAATDMTTRADRRERRLRDQRPQALDHRRRRVEAAPDLRPRVRRGRARARASAASSPCATRGARGW